ncbi:uncharacterized protein METZ01_LOCUS76499 [marine metagenome]|uniref:Uncharacterized protein n=1 Tax=marine metagenome TaxID=408172 RepID=A0A381U5W4_9ZZZZ
MGLGEVHTLPQEGLYAAPLLEQRAMIPYPELVSLANVWTFCK